MSDRIVIQLVVASLTVFTWPAAHAQAHVSDSAIACVVGDYKAHPSAPCTILANQPLAVSASTLTWTLDIYPTVVAARAHTDSTGIVVEADGRIWLFRFGPLRPSRQGSTRVAQVGPLNPPAAPRHAVLVAYAVVPPGAHSASHTHAGPEAWYVLSGAQCVETPTGVTRAEAGHGMVVPADTPMFLSATGQEQRRAFFVVVYDATRAWNTPVAWQPQGRCGGAP